MTKIKYKKGEYVSFSSALQNAHSFQSRLNIKGKKYRELAEVVFFSRFLYFWFEQEIKYIQIRSFFSCTWLRLGDRSLVCASFTAQDIPPRNKSHYAQIQNAKNLLLPCGLKLFGAWSVSSFHVASTRFIEANFTVNFEFVFARSWRIGAHRAVLTAAPPEMTSPRSNSKFRKGRRAVRALLLWQVFPGVFLFHGSCVSKCFSCP